MLTKEFLKFRVRSGRAYPTLLDEDNSKAGESARKASEIARRFVGSTLQNLQDEVQLEDNLVQAMVHIIVGSSDTEDADDVVDQRWQWLLLAEEIRQETQFDELVDFDREFSLRA